MSKISHILFIAILLFCSACALDADRILRTTGLASKVREGCHQTNSLCNKYDQCVYNRVKLDHSIKKDDITAYSMELSGQLSEKSKNSRIQSGLIIVPQNII